MISTKPYFKIKFDYTFVVGSVRTTQTGVPCRKTPSITSTPTIMGSLLLKIAPAIILRIQGNTACGA